MDEDHWEAVARIVRVRADAACQNAAGDLGILVPAALLASAFNCKSGFVWRTARPNDLVCVTPESRARVAEENRTAAARVQPGGAYGPNTCRSGYVWREAFSGDVVCVNPQIRALVAQENQLSSSRLASAIESTPAGSLKSGSLPSKHALPRL